MAEISEFAKPFPHRAGNIAKIQYATDWTENGVDIANHYVNLTRVLHKHMTPFVSKNPREAFLNYRDLDIGATNNGKNSFLEGTVYGINSPTPRAGPVHNVPWPQSPVRPAVQKYMNIDWRSKVALDVEGSGRGAIRMQIILEANSLWEMIEPLETTKADNKKDRTAIAFLYQALPEEQLLQITKHKTTKAIWDALKTRHIGEERVQQAMLQTLKSDFEMLHMKEDETIDTFTGKLTTLENKAASLGHTIEDQTLVRKLLNAVPDRRNLEPTLLMAILEDSDIRNQVKEVEEQKVSLHEEDVGYKETNMDSLWYLNNGASNHMTGVREHFKELDENVNGKVRFGDSSYIEIKGKCSILIECDDKKQRIISHVYYIPSLKSKLLSLGQFTKIGCKIVIEDDELRLYDMDNKIFMKVTRQRNRLHKPNLKIVERRNRTIMSTTRCMMKATNMSQNFWAEAVRHAIYILNSVFTKALDDITPYEAIKQRKPNLENLRVFGCIAYAKVPSQCLTKLNDRSSRMVYLGNKPGSKAYRLFDPTTQKICVSRDVKFKENETWDWKEYMSEHSNDEPEWIDFKIGNLEVTSEHHDQGTQPIKEDNESPNNGDDGYASPTTDSFSHS
nr:ribonuclease H-like domain, reverse transcriptase, RNA-dependent DNA polymerase [Tanacetum cinerariifolium]